MGFRLAGSRNFLYPDSMERIVHIARSHAEAALWAIEQELRLTPQERQAVSRELRRRVWGDHPPDVREAHRKLHLPE
jgi:hypothetical protein